MDAYSIYDDPLAVIYNEGCWRIYKISPMFNLQYSDVRLKQYASKICQALVSILPANSGLQYKVFIENLHMLKYSHDDSNAIMITVESSKEEIKDSKKATSKITYVAILLSWGMYISIDNATHLPFMLERGDKKVAGAVKKTLQMLFDCNIKQYNFTEYHMLQFMFNFIENDISRISESFLLIYKTNCAIFKGEIKLSINIDDIETIWNRVKDESRRDLNPVIEAYHLLQSHIMEITNMDITSFSLCDISFNKAEIKSEGIVKMKTPELVNATFTVLNEITQ